ncbi:hypothetical protein SELMODRAFT_402428 [Selaginella moellendorffii]|uniref:Flavanone 4-reductase n=1 Tax=Selaginella moellendorffii TaxID=88036 RepID=D8QQL5_SELML|nr:hypothetical protein SELMODRAFT_402428 [Selaginella moellendorffii]
MENEKKVCVTGAAGFLASLKRLLEERYHVVGTVRESGASERLELKNADLVTEGAFDDIVQGCHGVFHVAAAVSVIYKKDPQTEIVDPCLLGTLNVLNACKRSTTVKRVVCTSSVGAVRVRDGFKPDDVLDESMWYPLGKTLAEQAALEFGKDNGLDVITISPSLIVGELLSSSATTSTADIVRMLKGDKRWFDHGGYVHLDDVAQAHLLAYTNPNASGRYVCSAINMSAIELASFMSKRYPKLPIASTDEIEVVFPANFKGFSSRKLRDDLGLQFKLEVWCHCRTNKLASLASSDAFISLLRNSDGRRGEHPGPAAGKHRGEDLQRGVHVHGVVVGRIKDGFPHLLQVDQPGIIGKAGGLLSVNVSFMSVGMTSPRKQAVRAIGVDEEGSAAQDPGHPNGLMVRVSLVVFGGGVVGTVGEPGQYPIPIRA